MKRYILELPISKNRWLKTTRTGIVYTTKEYKDYCEYAYYALMSQGIQKEPLKEDKIVIDCWWWKKRKNQDCGNFLVSLEDVIKKIIKIDDSYFLSRSMDYIVDTKNPHVEFSLYNL